MFDVIGSIVISLSRCCLPNDEIMRGQPSPQIFFPRTAPAYCILRIYRNLTNVKSPNNQHSRTIWWETLYEVSVYAACLTGDFCKEIVVEVEEQERNGAANLVSITFPQHCSLLMLLQTAVCHRYHYYLWHLCMAWICGRNPSLNKSCPK